MNFHGLAAQAAAATTCWALPQIIPGDEKTIIHSGQESPILNELEVQGPFESWFPEAEVWKLKVRWVPWAWRRRRRRRRGKTVWWEFYIGWISVLSLYLTPSGPDTNQSHPIHPPTYTIKNYSTTLSYIWWFILSVIPRSLHFAPASQSLATLLALHFSPVTQRFLVSNQRSFGLFHLFP